MLNEDISITLEDIEKKLKKIIREEAYNNNFELYQNTVNMCKAIKYLSYQIIFLKKFSDNEEFEEHCDTVINNVEKIL